MATDSESKGKTRLVAGGLTTSSRPQPGSSTGVDRLARLKSLLEARRTVHEDSRDKRVANLIAAVISKTYAECGDGAKLADDTALMIIRDILLELDERIIKRNKKNKSLRSFMANKMMYRVNRSQKKASGGHFGETE